MAARGKLVSQLAPLAALARRTGSDDRQGRTFNVTNVPSVVYDRPGSVFLAKTLDQINEGEEVRIVRIGGRGAIRRRLLDMGVTRGTKVLLKRRAPLGDPLQIEVKGYNLAIRNAEARCIEVQSGDGLGERPPEDTDGSLGLEPAGKV